MSDSPPVVEGTPEPTAATEPARDLSGLRDLVERRGAAGGDAIALTFDDGPVARTEEAAAALEARGVRATFFFVGEKVRGREALVERVLAAGHEVANHSFHHLYYPSRDDILSASAQLRAITGKSPRLYRPPFGAIDRPTALAVREAGMTPVTWDVDSEDIFPVWQGLEPARVHRNVVDRARPGSIVLLHDGSVWSRAVEALPAILDTLLERGYRPVTVSELLAEAPTGEGAPGVTDPRGEGHARHAAGSGRSRGARLRRALARRGRALRGDRAATQGAAPPEPRTALGWGEELEGLRPREVLERLERRGAADERLGRAVAGRVAVNPVAFSRLAERVLALDDFALRWVLSGLAQGVVRTGSVDWDGVLALVEATWAPREDPGPDVRPARREAALLLEHALAAGTVPATSLERAWASIERLSWSGLDERGGAGADGGGAAAEDEVRVHAMCAVVRFAERARGRGAPPAARAILDAHLDPAREPSEGVRAVYGSQLVRLLALDRDWLVERLPAILPADEENAHLRAAAWAGHLMWGAPDAELFALLEPEYRREVEALPAPPELRRGDHGDPGRIVARHLGDLVWTGALDLDPEGVVALFIARAAADELAYLVKQAGLRAGGDEAVDEPVRRRLAALWEAVADEAARRTPAERAEIVAPFGTWYASGALEQSALDAELAALLGEGILVEPPFRVLERLAARAGEDPGAAVELAAGLVALAGAWDLRAADASLRTIVERSLAAGDASAAAAARALAGGLPGRSRGSRPADGGQSGPSP